MRLVERFDHQSIARQMLDFRPTLFFGVPTMYVRLLEVERSRRARDRQPDAAVRVRLRAAAGRASARTSAAGSAHRILERYGMTETLMNIVESLRRRAARRNASACRCRRQRAPCRRRGPGRRRRPGGRGVGSRTERLAPATGATRRRRRQRSPTAGSGPAISDDERATATTRCTDGGATSSSPAASTSTRARSRTSCASSRASPRRPSSASPTSAAAKCRPRSSSRRTDRSARVERACREQLASFKVPGPSPSSSGCRRRRLARFRRACWRRSSSGGNGGAEAPPSYRILSALLQLRGTNAPDS